MTRVCQKCVLNRTRGGYSYTGGVSKRERSRHEKYLNLLHEEQRQYERTLKVSLVGLN
jgi:hypothetical protein